MRRGRGGGWTSRLADLAGESLAGIAARPARLMLTTLGTALGVGALVATIGLSQTASGQLAKHFDAVDATQVVVSPRQGDREESAGVIPWDAADRASQINGLVAAGTFTRMDVGEARVRSLPVVDPTAGSEHVMPVVAASPGLLDAVRGDVVSGRFFDSGHDQRQDRVAVLGRNAADRLHVTRVDAQPSVFVGDETFSVVGIVDGVARRTELLDAVIVPNGTAERLFDLESPAELHLRTRVGAARQVGRQAPLALDPNNPDGYVVRVPPTARELRDRVQADVNALFLALGGVALLVGGVGIANITLLSVLERVGEIGLRRALGATRSTVAAQFLVESFTVGMLGGVVGSAAGVVVTVAVAVLRDWTALLDPALPVGAPLLGGVVGLVAGTYPAWRASAIEPITALRAGA